MYRSISNFFNGIRGNELTLVTYISTYGFRCLRKGRGICLEVGAKGRDNFKYPLHDDIGDNISFDNKYYGDLTALYWIWKNSVEGKEKAVAFRHYNKYLFIKKKSIFSFLKENRNGWIVAKNVPIPPHKYQYEWECFREIIKERYPVYYEALVELYDYTDGSGCQCNHTNMFITSFEQMDAYCSVIFDICENLRRKIGNTDHSRRDQRYCAFMAERFLSVYIKTQKLPKLEVDVCRCNIFLYCSKIFFKKIGIKPKGGLLRMIKKHLYSNVNRSSYEDYE